MGNDYQVAVPASQRNDRLMLKLATGETIYIDAQFAGVQSEFRHLSRRAAMEKVRDLIVGKKYDVLTEEPRFVILA